MRFSVLSAMCGHAEKTAKGKIQRQKRYDDKMQKGKMPEGHEGLVMKMTFCLSNECDFELSTERFSQKRFFSQ